MGVFVRFVAVCIVRHLGMYNAPVFHGIAEPEAPFPVIIICPVIDIVPADRGVFVIKVPTACTGEVHLITDRDLFICAVRQGHPHIIGFRESPHKKIGVAFRHPAQGIIVPGAQGSKVCLPEVFACLHIIGRDDIIVVKHEQGGTAQKGFLHTLRIRALKGLPVFIALPASEYADGLPLPDHKTGIRPGRFSSLIITGIIHALRQEIKGKETIAIITEAVLGTLFAVDPDHLVFGELGIYRNDLFGQGKCFHCLTGVRIIKGDNI